MSDEYEVKKVHKVVMLGLKFGEAPPQVPLNQFWYVVEHIKTGQRFSEHDDEADAITHCEQLNSQQKDGR